MQTITALIPAKNEEKNIKRCLESVMWCDRVVVICTGTDKTATIAKKLGADVMIKNKSNRNDFEELQRNINLANETATTDWILRVDADEVVTPELQEEIKQVLKFKSFKVQKLKPSNLETFKPSNLETLEPNISPVAYGIPRIPNFLGTFLKGGDWAYDRLVRLYRPKFCRFDPIVKVHEQFKVKGTIGYLKNSLLHYSHPDKKTLLEKFDTYTTLEAEELKDTKLSAFLKLIFVPPYIFLRWMIYHHGYRDGLKGVEAGLARAYYDVQLYYKFLKLHK